MKKLITMLLAALLVSQSVLAASYTALPYGDGRVEVSGTKNADYETTFFVADSSAGIIKEVSQLGEGEGEFTKTLNLGVADDKPYIIYVGNQALEFENIKAVTALQRLNDADTAEEFDRLINLYTKIFCIDTSYLSNVCVEDEAVAYLLRYDFQNADALANDEYKTKIDEFIIIEIGKAYDLVKTGNCANAITTYHKHFGLDIYAYNSIADKDLVHTYLNGKSYSNSVPSDAVSFKNDFDDAVTLAKINEASGNDLATLIKGNWGKIITDVRIDSSAIPDDVYTKLETYVYRSFDAIEPVLKDELSLYWLNTASKDDIQMVIESDALGALQLKSVSGYSSLSADKKALVFEAMSRADFQTVAAARKEFASLILKVNANEPVVPNVTQPAAPGNSYSVSGSVSGGSVSGGAVGGNPSTSSLPFADIASSHWGYSAVAALYTQGVISGTSATTFEPERLVTREEFIKMLVATFGMYNANAKSVFADVPDGDWCASYVASAYEKGLTEGKGDGSFGRGETLSRQDMATLASRCADIANLKLSNVNSMLFTDEADFASYAKDSIYKLSAAGIINGMGGGVFSPASGCTRAMAAKVCNELLKLYKGGAAQ